MKNKMRLSKRQQGQAIVEMCVSLIPILVVLLGMVFISGMCISNIRAFVEAKGNAELTSRSGSMVGGSGDNVFYWDYGDDSYPFTADDKPVYFWQAGSVADVGVQADMQLNMVQDSESQIAEGENQYVFLPVASLPYISDDNFAGSLPDSMLAAAELVSGNADSGFNSVFTINSTEFRTDEINAMRTTFERLLGTDIGNINLRDVRANTVYYPAVSTSQ